MNKLNIFVSSTCYDLSQVRADMSEFIENSGHNPILSESTNFPINPSKSTLDNCISAVNEHADIFVLIVGARYGSKMKSGKSITNTEYLAAKTKGIPIYIFIKSEMIATLPFWNKNKKGDFSDIVDSIEIFEFITNLRDESKAWTFEFKHAQDIVITLKTQLSSLFRESLKLRNKFNAEVDELTKLPISTQSLKLVLEKPTLYESRFFFQCMIDEVEKYKSFKNDLNYSIILQSSKAIHSSEKILKYLPEQFSLFSNIIKSLETLLATTFKFYYGKPGIPSDLKGLYYAAQTYGRIYKSLLKWTLDMKSAHVNEDCLAIVEKASKLSAKLIEVTWAFPFKSLKELEENAIRIENNEDIKKLTFTLDSLLPEKEFEEYNKEFTKFSKKILDDKRKQMDS